MSNLAVSVLGSLVDPVETWNPERDAPNDSFVYIDLSAVDQDAKAITGAREIPCSEAPSRARQLVAAGDVLVSTVRPNLNAVARVPPEFDGATASTGFCVLRPRPGKLDGAYLLNWVRSPRFVSEMVRRATGASYPAVSDRIILESSLPLLPLCEQRRIAEVLGQAEALREKRRAAITGLDILTQSIFLDMFGDPATNPKEWPKSTIENVAKIVSGATPRTDDASYWDGDVNWVTPKELSGLEGIYIGKTERRITRRGLESCAATVLPPSSVLFSSRAPIGHTAICSVPMATNQGFKSFVPQPNVLEPHFLLSWLRLRRSFLESLGTGATFKEVSKAVVARIELFLPPFNLQRQFTQRLITLERIRAVQRKEREQLDALFASLQYRAFRGEL